MPALRLDKIISGSGEYSRNEADALIRAGRVSVGGVVLQSGAAKVDPAATVVLIDGKPYEYRRFRYVMLHKPLGYVSATQDRYEKTVMELMDEKYSKLGLFPAGRLDKDASGLLLLTNDGEFAYRVTSPSSEIDKVYFVEFDGVLKSNDIKSFSSGLTLADGTLCLPAVLEPVSGGAFVTLREGKYHQVKRMLAAIGVRVISLARVSIGGLKLGEGLKPGEYLELSEGEAQRVFEGR